ncbi:phosphoribosylamine--glycine ligase [Thalassoroseus pseudoceratinae]|uniref:phosphoribosylamine--glycine ligase n=1 Tax=Thalassoroseus pseudoceratinae TaxID=2713176 RepID=UPI0014244A17|nr:phosphoribosylamine--glycine ligase [Thalassoroseus pseudoceratinae]
MNVLVIGQGGREHALAWKLRQSPMVDEVFCAPGNAGTAADATNVPIASDDIPELVKFAQRNAVGLTVVGPEAPLVAGISDAFRDAGLRVFGPSRLAAELEGSKVFSKNLMRQAGVPTAEFRAFTNFEHALQYVETRSEQPLVVKADGLAAGKGVTVCESREEANEAIKRIMQIKEFGQAGQRIVIEEKLVGQEASILAIVDGKSILPLESSQDHKPAFDDDKGPNTGGMGAYSPTPLVSQESMDTIIEKILIPTIHTLRMNDRPFMGVLYAGLMMTAQGPRVLEYNVRFGDPEAQPVLMRLKTDVAEVLLAASEGRLSDLPDLEWDPRPAVCVVMASEGYPGDYKKGRPIRGIADADAMDGVKVFHAGTRMQGGDVLTDGGRVLGVTALGDDVIGAKKRAYEAVKKIRWEGAWCRKDISDKARG